MIRAILFSILGGRCNCGLFRLVGTFFPACTRAVRRGAFCDGVRRYVLSFG